MNIHDIVVLTTHTEHHTRGIIGNKYKIGEIKRTEIKLCSLDAGDYCFYTHPDNVSVVVEMSVPDGLEFGVDYDIDTDAGWFGNSYVGSTTAYKGMIDNIMGKNNESEAFAAEVDSITQKITNLLKEKNKAYGNTALNPVNIFSELDASEAICARLDDKIMRIKNKGINDETEDTVDDLIGYLILLKMSM